MVQLVQGIVDTQKNICRSLGRANAGDDLKLELEIQMNGQHIAFVNPMCELLIKKADNNKVRQTNGILYQDGKFKIKVDQQGVTCPGTVINQLIINDEGKISTCLFYFTVGASLEKEILQSISKVETLEQLDEYVVAAFSNLDEYEKRLTELNSTMTTTNEEITVNESERKSNESERKDNETLRIENEKERVKKANEISASEIDRKASELDREKNENARRIAENTRIARENSRENAEINRNAVFEENEAIRTEAEKLRVQAEIKRKESFSNLESLNDKLNAAEENRVNSEEDRRTKETERQLAEAERERSEANREKTYTNFNDAEVDRKNNENARIQAENLRVQAESIRAERFETAQSTRETKFQESENNRDKLFKTNETARATEEIARKQAESTREGNEAIRVNSESLRVASEKARQQEEIKRGQSEVSRVEAEEARELSYEAIKKDNSTFKQQMNEDFGNAKADYFGKEHLNVVDRLNNDFDNVHQRINDASYLEYEGSNIQADNSYYGYTKELSVKGRTLQNLTKASTVHGKLSTFYFTDKSHEQFLKPNTKYTMILYPSSTKINKVYLKQGTTSTLDLNSKNMALFTTIDNPSSVTEFIHFYTKSDTTVNEVRDTKIMLLEGDYTNVNFDIPYFEGIKSVSESDVTEEGKYPVNIKSYGKNLVDISTITNGHITSNGELTISKHNALTPYIKIKSNTPYIGQAQGNSMLNNYSWFDSNKNFIKRDSTTGYATSPSNAYYLRYHNQYTPDNVMIDLANVKIQVSEGTSINCYEPYQETTQEIQLTEPLRNLSNGVCDEILEDGTEIRRVGKVVLNGSEKWSATGYGGHPTRNTFECSIEMKPIGIQKRSVCSLCDKFNWENTTTLPDNDNSYRITHSESSDSSKYYFLFCPPTNLIPHRDVNAWKQWLSENPITVYYELVETIITKHNKNINLKTYDRTTHITSDNYLQPKLSCKVPSNVQAVVSNLKEENEALNTKVSTLNLENEEIKETNANQDELINTTMMATDEMYMMLEPLLANILADGEVVSPLVNMYVAMIKRGLKTIEQVPEKYREQVEAIINESH